MHEASQGGDRLALLQARIRRLYQVEAGQPSYPMLARVADSMLGESKEDKEWLRPLPRATACDLVNGKYRKCPDWWQIRMLVLVCHRIATKSDLDIASLEELLREFSRLWQAAKAGEESITPLVYDDGVPADLEDTPSDVAISGDVLEPEPGEPLPLRTSPAMHRIPKHWGRASRRRLDDAEAGDARAAYEVAVLLACEALGKGEGEEDAEEAKYWRDMAAYWRGRAVGKIAEAAELRLQGVPLAAAAYAIAVEYKKLGKRISMDFFEAATQADASIRGSRIAPPIKESSDELVVVERQGK